MKVFLQLTRARNKELFLANLDHIQEIHPAGDTDVHVAQRKEQRTSNSCVDGSNPAGDTNELLPCPFCGCQSIERECWLSGCPACTQCTASASSVEDWNARSQPKMQRVDLEMAYKNFPEGDDIYSLSPHDRGRIEGYNRAIDDIKAKYGDLYVGVE